MKIKSFFIVMLTLMMLFSGCSKKSETTPTEEKQTEEDKPVQTKQEETITKKETADGFSILASYIEKINEMTAFMEEGIDKSGDMNLSMEFLTIKMSGAQLAGALGVFNNYGTNWDSGVLTDEDYDITTRTQIVTENGVTTYKNFAYESAEAAKETVSTVVYYDSAAQIVQIETKVAQPESSSVYQFYLDDSGALYYVFGEMGVNTLFTDVMYYDDNFIGISKVWFDGAKELKLPYDLSGSKPTGYADLLVYDTYQVEFTYDGAVCEYKVDY